MEENQLLAVFKEKASKRGVDTCNKLGYDGYKGIVYKLGNLEFFDTINYHRFADPTRNPKYLNGTTRISKSEFVEKLKILL